MFKKNVLCYRINFNKTTSLKEALLKALQYHHMLLMTYKIEQDCAISIDQFLKETLVYVSKYQKGYQLRMVWYLIVVITSFHSVFVSLQGENFSKK